MRAKKKEKHCNWWCAACEGQYEWRAPNRILVVQLGTNANEAKPSFADKKIRGFHDTSVQHHEV